MKSFAILLGAAALLSGCASAPPDRFYSLSSGAPSAPPAPAGATPLYIEVLPVTIPAQVRRSQLVVSEGEGRVDLLEHQRWAGPLGDEIGRALSLDISNGLGALDVYRTPTPQGAVPYRIGTTVQRFESAPGAYALLDATWSVRKTGSDAVLACRSVFREEVGPGYEALVAGHRAALARLAGAIGAAVRRQEAGSGGC